MKLLTLVIRRTFGWCRSIVDSVRHGEDDMRTIYGDHPNGAPSPEQAMLEGSVAHNIGNMGAGGLG